MIDGTLTKHFSDWDQARQLYFQLTDAICIDVLITAIDHLLIIHLKRILFLS